MRKTLVFLVAIMIVLMTACESNSKQEESQAIATPRVVIVNSVGNGANYNQNEVKIENSIDENDPYGMFLVDEEYARAYVGCCVRRGSKLYSVDVIEREKCRPYGFGQNDGVGGPFASLYLWENWDSLLSMGEVPIMTISAGDEIISFGGNELILSPAEFVGYSVRIIWNRNDVGMRSGKFVYESLDSERTRLGASWVWDTLEVHDSKGNLIERENWRNIPYRELCTVGWFERVQYHEFTMEADCSYYRISEKEGVYVIDGDLHKESYASFDISGVTPGLYALSCSGSSSVIVQIG